MTARGALRSNARCVAAWASGAWLLACSATPGPPQPPAHAVSVARAKVKAPAASFAAEADRAAAPATPPPPPPPDETSALLALSPSASTSLGAPGHGTLEGGVALPDHGPGFTHNGKRPPEARYGTVELVQAIARAAAAVDAALPGSGLVVNDLSLQHGGPIAQHGSHQNGRDADILFYVLDQHGAPIPSVGVPIEPDGTGIDFNYLADGTDDIHLRLDRPRTWRFVAELISLLDTELQRIFIVEHVRGMLLDEAARVKAPQAIVARFADLTCQPAPPHDDHMHVRLFCSAEDIGRGCLDKPPIYPFRTDALAALGLEPLLEKPGSAREREERAEQVRARTTTPEQAAKRAGPMHKLVRQFLARRRAWMKVPHPGRPYCK